MRLSVVFGDMRRPQEAVLPRRFPHRQALASGLARGGRVRAGQARAWVLTETSQGGWRFGRCRKRIFLPMRYAIAPVKDAGSCPKSSLG